MLMSASRLTVLCCVFIAAGVLAQQPPPPPAPPAAPPAAAAPAEEWHTIAKGQIKLELELDGVVEAAQMTPVEVKLKQWPSQSLKLIDPIEQGREVRRGDTLVAFDTEEIDKVIRDTEIATEAAKVALDGARHDLALLERGVEIDLASAARGLEYARFDLDYFTKLGRSLAEEGSADRLKMSRYNLEYAQEELKQLKQMYKEDELTEETEEIILTRQERSVELSQRSLEQFQESHKQLMETTMPRRQKELEIGAEKTRLEADRSQATLPLRLIGARQALLRAEHAYADAGKKIKEIKADREALVVRAPADGVVYYGRCERGRWVDGPAIAASMKPEGGFRPNVAFLTIVSPKPLFVRTEVVEANVRKLSEGLTGWLTPTANPYEPLAVKLRSVGKLPVGAQHDVTVDLGENADAAGLLPGMTGKLKFVTYDKADALKVPLAAVKSDSPGRHHVIVKTDQGTQKRDVKLGQRTATEAEVIEGLAEGDKVHPRGEQLK